MPDLTDLTSIGFPDMHLVLNLNTESGAVCGDSTCDPGEDRCNCPDDCGSPDANEAPGETCRDGLDNDCDGPIDCADPDCADDPACGGDIPTVSQWVLIIMGLLAWVVGTIVFGRGRPARASL